jgi:hypothetical protein
LGHVQPPILYGEHLEPTRLCCRGRHKSSATSAMPPSLTAALVAALLTATWWLGRRRVPLLPSTDTSDVAALNRAQIALVQAGGAIQPAEPWPTPPGLQRPASRPGTPDQADLQTPATGAAPAAAGGAFIAGSRLSSAPAPGTLDVGGRASYQARLDALYRGDGASRLLAIQAAHRWGDRLSLPLLRRALRDSDPKVIRAAALAIERYRGRTAAVAVVDPSPLVWRPRRVARTR